MKLFSTIKKPGGNVYLSTTWLHGLAKMSRVLEVLADFILAEDSKKLPSLC